MAYISDPDRKDFQPMNISFGLMPTYLEAEKRATNGKKISKGDRRLQAANRALAQLNELKESL